MLQMCMLQAMRRGAFNQRLPSGMQLALGAGSCSTMGAGFLVAWMVLLNRGA